MAVLADGPVQVAYGVADVEVAALRWAEVFGAGPFFVRHHIPVTDVLIDGTPGSFDHSSAYGQWGSVMVELVAVHKPLALATSGLHHVAYIVDSFDETAAALADQGWSQTLYAVAGQTEFAFHDARGELGHLIEIYQTAPRLLGFYHMVATAAADWSGTDPVRILD